MKEKMRFEYVYRNTASDLWQLSMYYTYGSMVGVCNIIFTAAMFILAAVRWGESSVWMRTAIVLGCCLFTIFQPSAKQDIGDRPTGVLRVCRFVIESLMKNTGTRRKNL